MNKITKICLNVCVALILSSSVSFGMMEEDERPNEHFCPATMNVMRTMKVRRETDVADDDPSYARSSLLEYLAAWLVDSPNSLITGVPLAHQDLFNTIATEAMREMMEEDERPNEHFCPITMKVMREPVVAADGHSYERLSILDFFDACRGTSPNSPITGVPLANQDLFDNDALKAMIMDWKPGRQSGPSELDTRDAGSLAERVKEEFRKNAALLDAAKGQHIVAFLGNTGAGKSTLVNLLAGKELIPSKDGEDYILADPQDLSAMVIGTTENSETLYPKFIDVGGLRFFDLPGFNHTDGSERNLVNAAFTRKILLDAASVRLVFVAGQDQFTADCSASVINMFHSIKRLFVADHKMSLIDNSVFVATKITCKENTEMTPFLLKETDASDKEELNQQLLSWSDRKRIGRMFHPSRGVSNEDVKAHILGLIQETEPTRILGLNVSALYPPDTKGPLERLFFYVMEEALKRQLIAPLMTLADYDNALKFYASANYWSMFEGTVSQEEEAIRLLKEFCIIPYTKALRRIERENKTKRQEHIQSLRKKRQERVADIGRRTEVRAREVISTFVPQRDEDEEDDLVFFDFAYRGAYYDQVCGINAIHQLATDSVEQEIVRKKYAGFIARYCHEQMMRWQDRFSGVSELTKKGPSAIPEVARGFEDIYERFLKGVLVYLPNKKSNVGRVEMRIADLANPLGSTFDLSKCGDAGKSLSIATGYRREENPANANRVEIWFCPWFLVNRELSTMADNHHLRAIIERGKWDAARAPIGIFWTWGGWNGTYHMNYCDYLTKESLESLGSENLYLISRRALISYQLLVESSGPVLGATQNFYIRF